MSNWTHNACAGCYGRFHPGREPHVLIEAELEWCCFCGAENLDGIYVRHDPGDGDLACGGDHDAYGPVVGVHSKVST